MTFRSVARASCALAVFAVGAFVVSAPAVGAQEGVGEFTPGDGWTDESMVCNTAISADDEFFEDEPGTERIGYGSVIQVRCYGNPVPSPFYVGSPEAVAVRLFVDDGDEDPAPAVITSNCFAEDSYPTFVGRFGATCYVDDTWRLPVLVDGGAAVSLNYDMGGPDLVRMTADFVDNLMRFGDTEPGWAYCAQEALAWSPEPTVPPWPSCWPTGATPLPDGETSASELPQLVCNANVVLVGGKPVVDFGAVVANPTPDAVDVAGEWFFEWEGPSDRTGSAGAWLSDRPARPGRTLRTSIPTEDVPPGGWFATYVTHRTYYEARSELPSVSSSYVRSDHSLDLGFVSWTPGPISLGPLGVVGENEWGFWGHDYGPVESLPFDGGYRVEVTEAVGDLEVYWETGEARCSVQVDPTQEGGRGTIVTPSNPPTPTNPPGGGGGGGDDDEDPGCEAPWEGGLSWDVLDPTAYGSWLMCGLGGIFDGLLDLLREIFGWLKAVLIPSDYDWQGKVSALGGSIGSKAPVSLLVGGAYSLNSFANAYTDGTCEGLRVHFAQEDEVGCDQPDGYSVVYGLFTALIGVLTITRLMAMGKDGLRE